MCAYFMLYIYSYCLFCTLVFCVPDASEMLYGICSNLSFQRYNLKYVSIGIIRWPSQSQSLNPFEFDRKIVWTVFSNRLSIAISFIRCFASTEPIFRIPALEPQSFS